MCSLEHLNELVFGTHIYIPPFIIFTTVYFFGLFEGETGEKAPWFLRPSITFPLAFLIVGAAFFVQFSVGGIKERGAQVTDELDEIILSAVSPEARAVLTLAALACQLPL